MRKLNLLLPLALLLIAAPVPAAPRHVVVMVWDGMRPDFISETNTPTLFQLARDGVSFENHHSVYPSSTEVNGTAIATGCYPDHSFLIANREYRPSIDPLKSFATESLPAMRKADESGGKYLDRLTMAEIVQRNGLRTAVAGTKPVVHLQDRAARSDLAESVNLAEGKTLPSAALDRITQAVGAFPAAPETKIDRDAWTTRALTESLWEKDVPALSVLWMGEPDFSQHATAPGSERSLRAVHSSDENLARVLKILESKGVRATTDVIVVSDHGFSSIGRTLDVAALLRAAGFDAERELKHPLGPGEIMVVGNGGTVLLYVGGHDAVVSEQLARFFQQSDFAGAIFSREKISGTFALDSVNVDSPQAPDLLVSMRWEPATNAFGAPGTIACDLNSTSKGSHVTLSRFDLHNICVAQGPDFKRGLRSTTASGNTDIAPTALRILGLTAPVKMDGRVLAEAMTLNDNIPRAEIPAEMLAEIRLENKLWKQYLKISRVNGVIYFDEGNGAVHTP